MQLSPKEPGRGSSHKTQLPSISVWETVTDLVRYNLCDEDSLKALPFDIGQAIVGQLCGCTGESRWPSFRRYVADLWSREGGIPPALAARIASARDNEGRSIFQVLLKIDDGVQGIRALLDGGVSPEQCHYRPYFDRERPAAEFSWGTLLHQAALEGKAAVVAAALQNGAQVDALDSRGRTPLQLCGAALRLWLANVSPSITSSESWVAERILNAAKELLNAGADPSLGAPGESFLMSYLAYLPSAKHDELGYLTKENLARPNPGIVTLSEVRTVKLPDAVDILTGGIQRIKEEDLHNPELSKTEIFAVREAIKSGISMRALVAMVETLTEIRRSSKHPPHTSDSLVPALPELLYSLPSAVPERIVSSIDTLLFKTGRNPWEPELFALFCRADIWRKGGIGPRLVEAITAPYEFARNDVDILTPRMCRAFAAVGELTWSHIKWKADTTSPGLGPDGAPLPTLIERYGFERLKNHPKAGPGFRREYKDGWIELSRGGILGSFESSGTVLVANSSPIFGRKLFHTPCYISPDFLPLPEAREPRRQAMIEQYFAHRDRFTPLLSPALHLNLRQQRNLARTLLRIKERLTEYSDWKCTTRREDTWNFTRSGPTMKAGAGYFSPGLLHILEGAKAHNRAAKPGDPPLALAWVPPNSPPLTYFQFRDGEEKIARELPLTDTVIAAIEARRTDTGTRDQALSSGEHQFFACGFANQAELVVLDKRRRRES